AVAFAMLHSRGLEDMTHSQPSHKQHYHQQILLVVVCTCCCKQGLVGPGGIRPSHTVGPVEPLVAAGLAVVEPDGLGLGLAVASSPAPGTFAQLLVVLVYLALVIWPSS